ncbi:UPF0223 family protein [Virgibacillus sp. JSM 102003]|uniref:UPF0223 family protein n=1 Tax=Virgibacillus sp. JSM 102003 TaxID=1562108 RepID=UPI0035C26BCC
MSYHYPLDETWSKEEIIDVVNFFSLIENAYEQQVEREELLAAYRRFKDIVPSKSEEKTYFADFEKASGYASYPVVKKARESEQKTIKLK